ncbi:hypothetical protein ABGB18_29830 [Nonomuraea sp. B12E4]|uniref:hypothetical protein n=1 Tax=Nonomuraea sp. B12E4 TaxID=3153564 RepID=UPI00325CF239
MRPGCNLCLDASPYDPPAMVPGCTVRHDEQAVATYCHTGDGGQWWTSDDAWSIGGKTA